MDENVENLLEYNHWANLRALESIKSLSCNNDRPLKTFSHVLLAEEIWLLRVKQIAPKEQNFWEPLTIKSCAELIERNKKDWTDYLIPKLPDVLEEKVGYVNSKGIRYENTLREIFTHVINHSSYHRGQVASSVRGLGGKPALTDYIVFARE